MHTQRQTPPPWPLLRVAGGLYGVIILLGLSAEFGIRQALFVPGGAGDTAARIMADLPLFRLGMAADLGMALADSGLALVFYTAFRTVAPGIAQAALVFRLMQGGLIAVGLVLFAGAGLSAARGEAVLADVFLALHRTGYDVGLAFFAINAFLMARLLVLSGWIHWSFAWAIAASGAVYLVGSLLVVLAPGLVDVFAPAYLLPIVAETAFCLRLLFGPVIGRRTVSAG